MKDLFADNGGRSGPDTPGFFHEAQLIARLDGPVCGVDEAGRGPLAGPVVAAAVILDRNAIPEGINDSKKLSESARDQLYRDILSSASAVSVAMAPPARIDAFNIAAATRWAMRQAMRSLAIVPGAALIDGNMKPDGAICPEFCLVSGDSLSLSIAAASVVAKVTRDRLMARLDRSEPVYGFARHKGYGTAMHRQMLSDTGPSRHHRFSFAPVRLAADKKKGAEAPL